MGLLTHAFSIIAFVVFAAQSAYALKLSDYSPYEYDVRFTNPVCKQYRYEHPVQSRAGATLKHKPVGAYCSNKDLKESLKQADAPIAKLLQWINDPATTEIFFTYLSYSSEEVTQALCKAIEERDVKVTFVLDRGAILDVAQKLLSCKAPTESRNPRMEIRGVVGGLGYAHNKIFIVNPAAQKTIKIAFGSGNMTSGVILHHENWHFITTNPESYFAQAHLCAMEAELDHAANKETFSDFMTDCLGQITAEPEEDIQAFFVPTEGAGKAAIAAIRESLIWADTVKLAAHRFSNKDIIGMLEAGLQNEKLNVKLLFDDDIFWAGTTGAKRPNTAAEFKNVLRLSRTGAQVRYVETNEQERLLHHNKFIVFEGQGRRAAFVGAGNFTGDGFTKNMENFYLVTIPEVTEAMSLQFDHLYFDLASIEEDLPVRETPVATRR